MSGSALILVDIQNDYFEDGCWSVHEMEAAAQNAAALLKRARTRGDMVIHIWHKMPSDAAPFFRPGTPGAEINNAVKPAEGEAVIAKSRPNSFVGTDLEERLRSAEVEKVIICGAMSQMCIDATTRGAVDLGFKVTLAHDACGARAVSFGGVDVPAELVHAAFMGPLASSYAAVKCTAEILAGD